MLKTLQSYFMPIFRRRRMERMVVATSLKANWRVIDLGGTPPIWDLVDVKPFITFVNLDESHKGVRDGDRLSYVSGDATSLDFSDRSFDMVFSNSLIEHLHTWQNQVRCAGEVRRLSGCYWVQTPARLSLIEPHFAGLIGHWLPKKFRPFFIRWFSLYGWKSKPSKEQCDALVDEIRLLTRREMVELFPDATILTERFLFFPKSYIAVKVSSH